MDDVELSWFDQFRNRKLTRSTPLFYDKPLYVYFKILDSGSSSAWNDFFEFWKRLADNLDDFKFNQKSHEIKCQNIHDKRSVQYDVFDRIIHVHSIMRLYNSNDRLIKSWFEWDIIADIFLQHRTPIVYNWYKRYRQDVIFNERILVEIWDNNHPIFARQNAVQAIVQKKTKLSRKIIPEHIVKSLTTAAAEDRTCSICCEPIASDFHLTECYHQFHHGCLNTWYELNDKCPNCNEKIK